MEKIKKNLPWILRIFMGALFLFSAYAKIYPSPNMSLGTFEAKQLLPMGFSEGFAAYFSRFIVAAEFAIGLGLLQPHYLKRFVVPIAITMLLLFTGQLAYDWMSSGIKEDCGCFGALMPFNTWESILKNVVAIGLLVWLWKILPADDKERNHFAIPMLIFTSFATLLYAIAPIQWTIDQPISNELMTEVTHSDFIEDDTTTLIQIPPTNDVAQAKENPSTPPEPEKPLGPKHKASGFTAYPAYIPPGIKIDEGRKLLCFFAAGCEHCQATVKKLTEMRAQIPDFPPMHIVFMDEETELIPEFFKNAGREYSHSIAPVGEFWKMIDASRDTPGVCYLWNGNILYFADGIAEKEFKAADLKKALAKTKF